MFAGREIEELHGLLGRRLEPVARALFWSNTTIGA
jgi:hypothetical protein